MAPAIGEKLTSAARSMGAKSRRASVEVDPDDLPLRSGGWSASVRGRGARRAVLGA